MPVETIGEFGTPRAEREWIVAGLQSFIASAVIAELQSCIPLKP